MILYDDVRTLTAARLLADCGRLPSVIVGSPPCQDASVANASGRGIDGERTGLFSQAIRIVGECRPVWCCFENVPGIRTRGADRIISCLEAEGYAVWPLVVGARHVGAPHKRDRVWFVAADADRLRELEPAGRFESEWGRPSDGDQSPTSDSARRTRSEAPSRGSENEGQRKAWGRPVFDRHDGDTDGAGLAQREGEPGDDESELPPALRAIGRAWRSWSVFLARHLRMAHGLSSRLARLCIAAYGDAVVPQITTAIGRTMMCLLPTDGAVLDLFCGAAGGWSLGLHRTGYRTIAACEIDPWRRAVFAANFS